MHGIRVSLETKYPQLKDQGSKLVNVLIAVLTRYQFRSQSDNIPNSALTADEVVQLGLFHYDSINNTLLCPFVFVWLLAIWSNHSALMHLKLEAYNEMQHYQDTSLPSGLQFWQHWEEFVAQFRVLKSSLLKGSTIPLTEFHAGALVSGEASSLSVTVTELTLCHASEQYTTTGTPITNMLYSYI